MMKTKELTYKIWMYKSIIKWIKVDNNKIANLIANLNEKYKCILN